ncbi:hypothetical protein OIO90_005394 [Microbotryomycetes sp. JL221]|nr:hypothetical protein OIO90_005394 [Microbotryomycetes sp. JL221]
MSTYGVVSPAMFLTCEAFHVDNARRDHVRYVDEHRQLPRYFAQHRRTVLEAALFDGRDKVGSVTEDDLELRDVKVSSDKLYKKGLFSRWRTWKGPDGLKYSWQVTDNDDLKMIEVKSNTIVVYCNRQQAKATRLIISAQVLPFIELVLLTSIQAEFEIVKRVRRQQALEDDKDEQLGVW